MINANKHLSLLISKQLTWLAMLFHCVVFKQCILQGCFPNTFPTLDTIILFCVSDIFQAMLHHQNSRVFSHTLLDVLYFTLKCTIRTLGKRKFIKGKLSSFDPPACNFLSLYLCQKVKLCSKGFSVALHDRESLATLQQQSSYNYHLKKGQQQKSFAKNFRSWWYLHNCNSRSWKVKHKIGRKVKNLFTSHQRCSVTMMNE